MNKIINNLNKQIDKLKSIDVHLSNRGDGFNSLYRQNIRACIKDIENVIKTLETIK
jgi:archaellum component FlaC